MGRGVFFGRGGIFLRGGRGVFFGGDLLKGGGGVFRGSCSEGGASLGGKGIFCPLRLMLL